MNKYKRGDIILVNLDKSSKGSVQFGVRPCVIISNYITNSERSRILNVIPVSSKNKNIPVHIKIAPHDIKGYLSEESFCMIEQIRTIDKSQVLGKMGHIKDESGIMEKINKAMTMQFEMMTDTEE